jgi:hypothetical protein
VRWFIAAILAATTACSGGSPLAPSPIIRPNAAVVRVGETQLFTVDNAVVNGFSLASDNGSWTRYIRVEPATVGTTNAIQLLGLERTSGGYVYISANIGSGQRPLVAVVTVE